MQFHEACRIVLFIFWAAIGSDGRSVYDGLLAFARAGALDKRDVLSSLALPLPGCPLQSQRHRQRAVLEQRTSASSHSATGVFFPPLGSRSARESSPQSPASLELRYSRPA